jgi:methylmalonyl-CoA mutase cobalamin-binding subunit
MVTRKRRRPAPRAASSRAAPPGLLTIGALSRATSIPVETLRTWELRYGFPLPERKPSGHRLYPVALVGRLRRVAAALGRGHRAGQVVPASEQQLDLLLAASPGEPGGAPGLAAAPARSLDELMEMVGSFRADELTRELLADWARLGPLTFLTERVSPLLRATGLGWAEGRLDVSHEHFVTERVGDVLRTTRLPLELRARGPLAVFATLPGEMHTLGLQMAALLFVSASWRVVYLGAECPPDDLVDAARALSARAVAVSVAASSGGRKAGTALRALRRRLPPRIALLAGGDGAPDRQPGVVVLKRLEAADAWARQAAN